METVQVLLDKLLIFTIVFYTKIDDWQQKQEIRIGILWPWQDRLFKSKHPLGSAIIPLISNLKKLILVINYIFSYHVGIADLSPAYLLSLFLKREGKKNKQKNL